MLLTIVLNKNRGTKTGGQSPGFVMPDGLLDSLTQAEAIHLLRFITEMGKIDGHVPTSPWCA